MKKKTKMKTKNIIQRLCLFFFVLLLAALAVAADYSSAGLREIPDETFYDRAGYEIFRSRNLGTHKNVTELKQGHVTLEFSRCNTTGGTGSSAIYELAKGSVLSVKADDGYAIRWIILRDTEGGESYRHPQGKYRISSVTSGYDYYFEKNAISNSKIKEGNQQDLNDDNNNIVVTGIDGVTDDNADMNAPVYDLQDRDLGTSLNHLSAGIYVVGGKKVIKK